MEIVNLGEHSSVFNQFIREIRDGAIQKDRMRFRRNLERIGEVFAYELSKRLAYEPTEVITPLGQAHMDKLAEQPVLATVLRAGLPLHQGLLNYFDQADNAFISAYRMHHKGNEFEVKVEYSSCPELTNRTLVLCDTMLATGSSMELSYRTLIEEYGKPTHTHVVSAITSTEGLDYISRKLNDQPITVWVGAIDDELTAQSYIVPGLGDAGDLAFGRKD